MPDMQEQINKILSNPEALRQVQSLGEQLGLNVNSAPQPPKPAPVIREPRTPFTFHADSTSVSSSFPVTS